MAALEAEWRRRERAREAEAAALRAEYAALQDHAKQVSVTRPRVLRWNVRCLAFAECDL